jgi:hypothetical protein
VKLNGFQATSADWFVDLSRDYVTHFPTGIGFDIGVRFADYESDGVSAEDFIAEPIYCGEWHKIPGDEELAALCRSAAALYAQRLLASLRQPNLSNIDENAA